MARAGEHAARPALRLRPAVAGDARQLFDWANDPTVRAMARKTGPIAWAGHMDWLRARLDSPDCRILLAEADGVPVGQVRLDRRGDTAEIDYSVDGRWRRRGFGALLLAAAENEALSWSGVNTLLAEVRRSNTASVAALHRAGYREAGADPDYLRFEKVLP